ncbi:hypothetical protein PM082_004089 [Marasmius tenuissimus]|nr:hypothetical protein PM082_004089 [Marasmius tenuissimus]
MAGNVPGDRENEVDAESKTFFYGRSGGGGDPTSSSSSSSSRSKFSENDMDLIDDVIAEVEGSPAGAPTIPPQRQTAFEETVV